MVRDGGCDRRWQGKEARISQSIELSALFGNGPYAVSIAISKTLTDSAAAEKVSTDKRVTLPQGAYPMLLSKPFRRFLFISFVSPFFNCALRYVYGNRRCSFSFLFSFLFSWHGITA